MTAPNTNLVRYSGMLDQGVWVLGNAAVAKLPNISPTGHQWRFIATGAEQAPHAQFIAQTGIPEFVENSTYTFSMWIKGENWPDARMLLQLLSNVGTTGFVGMGQLLHPNGNSAGALATLNLSTPPLTPWTNVVGGVEELALGWERVWVQGTSPNTPGATLNINLTTIGGEQPGYVGSSLLLGGFALDRGVNTAFADTTTAPRGNEFLPLFDFPFHIVESRYPVDGTSVQFGSSYTFSAAASGPPQRMFSLEFAAMRWFLDPLTQLVDPTQQPQQNLAALDAFYQLNRLSQPFHYPHPMYGTLVCRFLKPLIIPKQLPGGSGAVAPMTIELVEVP